MKTLFGFFLFLLPLIFLKVYAANDFGLSIKDNFNKWRIAKGVAVGISLFYWLIFFTFGHDYILLDKYQTWTHLDDWLTFYILPGIFLGFVVFSKPAGYFLADKTSFLERDIFEDAAFVSGNIGLFTSFIVVIIYSI